MRILTAGEVNQAQGAVSEIVLVGMTLFGIGFYAWCSYYCVDAFVSTQDIHF